MGSMCSAPVGVPLFLSPRVPEPGRSRGAEPVLCSVAPAPWSPWGGPPAATCFEPPTFPRRHPSRRTAGRRRGDARQRSPIGTGRTDLADRLASRSPGFFAVLPSLLAAAGDLHSQEAMLDDLKRLFDVGKHPEDDGIPWMETLVCPSLLPRLFEILRRSYGLTDEPVRGVTVGYGARDVVNPTIEAINRIGGRAAVAGYTS